MTIPGGNPPLRPDQAIQLPRSGAGSGPAPQSTVFIGRTVVVFGTGSGSGIFFYNGSPHLGNPPILAITLATLDPYGNPVTASAISDSGMPFLIYSGTPALGNLIVSLAPAAGVDDVGNAFPQGLNVTAGTISGVAISATTETLNPGPLLLYGNPATVVTVLSGSGNFLMPAGVTSVKAECWGGGGGGGGAFGGGAGGGEYASQVLAVTAGNMYAYTTGGGGAHGSNGVPGSAGGNSTFAGDVATVTGHGGSGGTSNGGTGGAGGTGSANTAHFNGGNGAGIVAGGGGAGGGGSGGTGSAGNAGHSNSGGTGGAGAAAVTGGGAGGTGGNNGANGVQGSGPGGGGGGSGSGATTGGNGASGQVRLTYTPSGVVSLLASLATMAGTDPATGTAFPGPGLGLNSTGGTPAALAGWATLYATSNGNLAFVSGTDSNDYVTGRFSTYFTGTQLVNSATFATVDGFTVNCSPGAYRIRVRLLYDEGAAAGVPQFRFGGTAVMHASVPNVFTAIGVLNATGGATSAAFGGAQSGVAFPTPLISGPTMAAAGVFVITDFEYEFTVITSGTVAFQAATSVAADTYTIVQGSSFNLFPQG